MMIMFIILAAIGFCISAYAYFVEQKIKTHLTFKPFCDINDMISCTKPMKSNYSNLFFFSNAFIGMLYYVLVAVLAFFDARILLLITASVSMLITCYLAYLLYFKIKSFCILCTSVYGINGIIFVLMVLQVLS